MHQHPQPTCTKTSEIKKKTTHTHTKQNEKKETTKYIGARIIDCHLCALRKIQYVLNERQTNDH